MVWTVNSSSGQLPQTNNISFIRTHSTIIRIWSINMSYRFYTKAFSYRTLTWAPARDGLRTRVTGICHSARLLNHSATEAGTIYTTVSRYRQCDGAVVIYSTNGHLVLITHLLSLSKIRALLRALYTMRYIDNAKGWLYFWEVLRCSV